MARTKHDLAAVLRDAIARDGRTAYRLAIDSGVAQQVLSRFIRAERDLTLSTASRLATTLGLQLK